MCFCEAATECIYNYCVSVYKHYTTTIYDVVNSARIRPREAFIMAYLSGTDNAFVSLRNSRVAYLDIKIL